MSNLKPWGRLGKIDGVLNGVLPVVLKAKKVTTQRVVSSYQRKVI